MKHLLSILRKRVLDIVAVAAVGGFLLLAQAAHFGPLFITDKTGKVDLSPSVATGISYLVAVVYGFWKIYGIIKDARDKVDASAETVNRIDRRGATAADNITGIKGELHETKVALAETQALLRETREELSKTKAALVELQASFNELQVGKDAVFKENARLKNTLSNVSVERDDFKQAAAGVEQELVEAKKLIKDLRAKLRAAQEG